MIDSQFHTHDLDCIWCVKKIDIFLEKILVHHFCSFSVLMDILFEFAPTSDSFNSSQIFVYVDVHTTFTSYATSTFVKKTNTHPALEPFNPLTNHIIIRINLHQILYNTA